MDVGGEPWLHATRASLELPSHIFQRRPACAGPGSRGYPKSWRRPRRKDFCLGARSRARSIALALRDEGATPPPRQKDFGPEGDGQLRPISSLLAPQRPLLVSSSLAPRFCPNSTRHAACADFSDSL